MGAETVLYLDDDRDFAELVELRLSRALDRPVETAATVPAALSRLDEGAVACLVLDYRLPGTDGTAVLDTARERHPDVPVVFFTGVDDPETAAAAREAGAAAFVTKDPGSFDTLADAVRDALG